MLRDDLADNAGADRLSTLADGESELFFHCDRHDQFRFDCNVIARHNHLYAGRQRHDPSNIGGAEIKLWPIPLKERRVTAALFLA